VVRKAILSKNKVYGWIIKPENNYNLEKNILIKHKNIIEINHIFIVDKRIEDYLIKIKNKPNFGKIKKLFNNIQLKTLEGYNMIGERIKKRIIQKDNIFPLKDLKKSKIDSNKISYKQEII